MSSEQGQAVNWDDVIIDAAATDTGMRRVEQPGQLHDRPCAPHAEAWRQRGHVFLVADGMGAHAVGELASKMACDLIPHNYMKTRTGTPSEAIVKAFREVSALIHSRATANRDFQGMGTTCSALLLLPEGALIAHVGDSRVYRVRGRPDRPALVRPQPGLGAGPAQPPDLRAGQRLASPRTSSPGAWARRSRSRSTSRARWPSSWATSSCSAPTASPGPVEDHELGAFAGELPSPRRLPLPGQPGQPARRARQHHGPDRPDRPLDRSRFGRGPTSSPTETGDGDTAIARGWRIATGRALQAGDAARQRCPSVEEHPYRTAECPIDEDLIDRLDELTRSVAGAGDRAGLVDRLDRAGQPAPPGGRRPRRRQRWVALRKLGEIITLLGRGRPVPSARPQASYCRMSVEPTCIARSSRSPAGGGIDIRGSMHPTTRFRARPRRSAHGPGAGRIDQPAAGSLRST